MSQTRKIGGSMKIEKYRSRKHCLLLYSDNQEHMEALEKIKLMYDCAYILHDKDVVGESGEILKPHYHIVISTDNQTWNTAIASELGIETRFLQKLQNEKRALEYLIHWNTPNKYQYDIKEVAGNLVKRLERYLQEEVPESVKVLKIISYIEKTKPKRIKDLVFYCCKENLYDVMRRNANLFIQMMNEEKNS